jgi:hypothetical protein
MLNNRFLETERALVENALTVEKFYAKELEEGKYEYALVSDFINSLFILEDEDEVDNLIQIEQIGGIVVYKPVFSDSNEEFWKCALVFAIKSSGGYYEEIESPVTIYGNTKEEVLANIENAIFQVLELNRICANSELCINYTIELNDEYNDQEEFYLRPCIVYTQEPSKLINWGEHTRGLPIIYSIDREKSKLNILED